MRSVILSLLVVQLIVSGAYSDGEERKGKPMCVNPRAKVGASILSGCSQATCKKEGKGKPVWQECQSWKILEDLGRKIYENQENLERKIDKILDIFETTTTATTTTTVDHPYPEFTVPGSEWSDSEYSDYGLIRQLNGKFGTQIDSLQFKFGETLAPLHGGSGGGGSTTCDLDPYEKIIKVKGYFTSDYGGLPIQLEFITDKPDRQPCKITGGYSSNIDYTFEYSHDGFYLAYMSGSTGYRTQQTGVFLVKSIVFHWRKI